jgi:hypothetical protein
MNAQKFDREQFLKSASTFKSVLELEGRLSDSVAGALAVVGEAAVRLVALSRDASSDKGPVITARISDTSVQITGGGRNVVFAAAHGCAGDQRLLNPRGEMCGQILVFSHLSGEDESTLVDTFRVYDDGNCSDGQFSWSIDAGTEAFMHYLSSIVTNTIFEAKVYWPAVESMPGFIKKIPVVEDELHEESLKRPCIGFDCKRS